VELYGILIKTTVFVRKLMRNGMNSNRNVLSLLLSALKWQERILLMLALNGPFLVIGMFVLDLLQVVPLVKDVLLRIAISVLKSLLMTKLLLMFASNADMAIGKKMDNV